MPHGTRDFWQDDRRTSRSGGTRVLRLRREDVSGLWRGRAGELELELRVDAGSPDSLDALSGDVYRRGKGGLRYDHSFQSTNVVLDARSGVDWLRAPVRVHRAGIPDLGRVELRIPARGRPRVTYTRYRFVGDERQTLDSVELSLAKISDGFRRVSLEIDRVKGVALPKPLRAGSAPTRSLEAAYRAAGVEITRTEGDGEIPVAAAGFDQLWSDDELYSAMAEHFRGRADRSAWSLYLLLATRYLEPDVMGIMFDTEDDFPRQAAAVFADHDAIRGHRRSEQARREYLFTVVHELGHAFNLLHSFEKGDPELGPLPRPDALSWMNYPEVHPYGDAGPEGWDGSKAFWKTFRFGFDPDELRHVRHGNRAEVIMGGREFGWGGRRVRAELQPPSREPDLSLLLWMPASVDFLQQLEGDVRLRNEGGQHVGVGEALELGSAGLELRVRRPGASDPFVQRPHAHRCRRRRRPAALAPGEARYRELAPSFDAAGPVIDEPGSYELQAACRLPDGRTLVSNRVRVRVLLPASREEDRRAADFFTREVGAWWAVEGSAGRRLRPAGEKIEEIAEALPDGALARQVSTATALRASRVFKDVAARRVRSEGRGEAAGRLVRALGGDLATQAIAPDPRRSNLRTARYLKGAALVLAAEGRRAELSGALALLDSLLAGVKAPAQARRDARGVRRGLLGSARRR